MSGKACIKCGVVKALDAFPKSRGTCKACGAAHARAYRDAIASGSLAEWQAANKLTRATANRECRVCGMEGSRDMFVVAGNLCIECNRTRGRAYYQGNTEKAKAATAAYRRTHRPQRNKRAAEMHAADPEKRNGATREKRAANPESFRRRENEYRQANREAVREASRAYRRAHPEQQASKEARVQRETLASATRRNFEWAGWEIETISDYSRTARALALQLGRTRYAVTQMRHLLRHDPQTIQRAGLSSDGLL